MKLFRAFSILVLVTTFFVVSGMANPGSEELIVENNVVRESPSTAVDAFFYSFHSKDVDSFKRRLTKKTLKMMEKMANEKDMTLKEFLSLYLQKNPYGNVNTLRNMKVNGKKATVEAFIKKKWEMIPLIKQDDIWRVDFLGIG